MTPIFGKLLENYHFKNVQDSGDLGLSPCDLAFLRNLVIKCWITVSFATLAWSREISKSQEGTEYDIFMEKK